MFALGLLTCVVLGAFSAQAKVVTSFDECKEFFYRDTEPGGMDQNARRICQLYNSGRGTRTYYATLYSVHHRIPLYSAYTFNPNCTSDNRRLDNWHFEPQISGYPTEHMVLEKDLSNWRSIYNEATIKASQAMSSDYSHTGYDRGHLNPNSFSCGDGRNATFTLTNAAPMDPTFNRIHWYKWERTLRKFLSVKLINDRYMATVYIVTGTVPNANVRIPQREISDDPERVSVPSHIWTAVCYKHHSDDRKSFSFGYIGENKPDEPDMNPMSVSDLNDQLTHLYSTPSGTQVKIFLDDCFGVNDKLRKAQEEYVKLMIPMKKRVQMSSDVQNTLDAVEMASKHNVKVSDAIVKLAFENMNTFYTMAEDLKVFAGIACVITHVKPLVRETGHVELRKRELSEGSDAVVCLLVPEKQKTAADGSICTSVLETIGHCQCNADGIPKPCCSTPCLYQDDLKGYRCYTSSAQYSHTQIKCSPRYSLVTVKGEKCMDDHPCATYDYDYYWCYTSKSGDWDYCSPPLRRSRARNGKYCHSNHACAHYGSKKPWCYTDDKGNYDQCCASDDCYSTVSGKTCRSNHKCGYNGGKTYLWCYTDYNDNWDYCCRDCAQGMFFNCLV